MTILQLNGIKKEFGAEVLLENIDFRVNAGEKIVVNTETLEYVERAK